MCVTINVLRKLAVIGAGLMGAGIANVSIDKGYRTILKDITNDAIVRGQNQIAQNLNKDMKKKKINKLEMDLFLDNLTTTTKYDDLKDVDMVIEAVFEDLALKHKVITELEKVL